MLTTLLTSTLLGGPGGDFRGVDEPMTITDIVLQSGGDFDDDSRDFDILLNAVVTADLAGVLADPEATLTVFAPTDRAFFRLATDLGFESKGGYNEEAVWNFIVGALTDLGGGDPIPVLTDVLTYHVAGGDIDVFGFILRSFFGIDIETVQGGTITPFFITLIDNDPDLRNPFLSFPLNVPASNGRIHSISRVLIPVDL